MCGIVGILNSKGHPVPPVILQRMTDVLAHRGPDGGGVYCDGPVGLGHRRLAILDLTPAGHQPMVDREGRFTLVYNGEIYNFQELRVELQARGHTFRSRTDTEVLLEGIAEWGPGILSRLNGMFAFAVWDRQERRLFLSRDRYGIKPLYYWHRDGEFLFASEIKAFLFHPSFGVQLDRAALLEYLTFQNLFTDRTLFEGVRLLPAGSSLFLRAERDARPRVERYWDYSFAEPEEPLPEAEYVEELERLFTQAVGRELVSDVPVASYLSGGLDSGSITAIAASQVEEMSSFTVGFDTRSVSGLEIVFDERERAEHLSYICGTEHYEMVLKAGDMERVLPRLIWHLEDLRVGQSYPNFYAAKLASRFVKVVLAGAGGDEMFGGYPWRYYRAVVNDDFEHYVDKYYDYWQRLIPADLIQKVLAPIWGEVRDVATRDIFRDVFVSHAANLTRPEDYVNHSLYFEAKTFLHGLLVVEDRLSMAHGLETRLPFLDNDLVDFALKVPVCHKLGNLHDVVRLNENEAGPKSQRYFEKTRDGKLILRKVLGRHVPSEIADAVKQGFSGPDASWFKGESIDMVERRLLSPSAYIYDVLDREAVTCLVQEHLQGRTNRRLLIWSLLCLEEWMRLFLHGAWKDGG